MIKQSRGRAPVAALLVAALLTLMPPAGQASAAYSFPYAGVRLEAEDGWTVLTPDALSENEAFLTQMGADPDALAADYAAEQTLFEAFLPDGAQVRLNTAQTEATEAWQDITRMSEADQQQLLDAFDRPPYEHTEWARALPGYLRFDWSLMAGETPVSFAGLATVREGALYTLVASGAVGVDVLQAAAGEVATRLTFLNPVQASAVDESGEAIVIPDAVEDDGRVTPIALVDFDGITYADTTRITVQTLPDTDVMLRTATDALRGRSDADGVHAFNVSTRRESVYSYTITAEAEAEGRSASEIALTLSRQLTQEEKDAAYRRTAQQIYAYGYSNMTGAPETFSDKPVTFRGRVGAFAELGGFPCLLVYTDNPGTGVWRLPMWVILTEPLELSIDDMITVYGDLRGDVLAWEDAGESGDAPVVISRNISL